MTWSWVSSALPRAVSVVALCASTLASADDHRLSGNVESDSGGNAKTSLAHIDSYQIDQTTAQALAAISENDLALARGLLSDLVERYPDYHLGQLLLAELHAANVSTRSAFDAPRFNNHLMQLLLEARARQDNQAAMLTPVDTINSVPSDILQVGKGLEFWIQANLEQGTQTVYEINNGVLSPHWRQYVGFGEGGFGKTREGDLKTPLGVYRINGYRDDASLPELYGSGALMLDYPNAADDNAHRTGSGIWLHGIPRSSRSRGPLSSEGCVTMGNDYLTAIVNLVDPDRTLIALSAGSAVDANTVDLANVKRAFDQWLSEQAKVSRTDPTLPQWSDATVAVSGAGAIESEVQEVVLYFPQHDQELSGFDALFLKRTNPGSIQWQVIADEIELAGA